MKEKLTEVEHEHLMKQVEKTEEKSAKKEEAHFSESTKKALGLIGY